MKEQFNVYGVLGIAAVMGGFWLIIRAFLGGIKNDELRDEIAHNKNSIDALNKYISDLVHQRDVLLGVVRLTADAPDYTPRDDTAAEMSAKSILKMVSKQAQQALEEIEAVQDEEEQEDTK